MSSIGRILRVQVTGSDFTDPLAPRFPEPVPERSKVPGPRLIQKLIVAHVTASEFDGSPGYPDNVEPIFTVEPILLTATFGDFELQTEAAAIPDSLDSTLEFGGLILNPPPDLYLFSLESPEVFGDFLVQDNGIEPYEFTTPVVFGTLEIATEPTVQPAAISSVAAFDDIFVYLNDVAFPDALDSTEDIGIPAFDGGFIPDSLDSTLDFGNLLIGSNSQFAPDALDSTLDFGTLIAEAESLIEPTALASTEAFGTPAIQGGAAPDALASTLAFGTLSAVTHHEVDPNTLATSAAIGTPAIQGGAAPDAIATTAAISSDFTISNSFDYSSFNWAIDLEGDNRSSHQITGTASGGSSSGRDWVSDGGDAIASGTSFNGHGSFQNDSDTIWSYTEFTLGDLVSGSHNAWTMFVVLYQKTRTAVDPLPEYYDCDTIMADISNYWGFGTYNTNNGGAGYGFVAGYFDGAALWSIRVGISLNTKTVIAVRRKTDGTFQIRKNNGSWANTTGTSPLDSGGDANYLDNYVSGTSGKADIARISVSPTAMSDTDVDNTVNYLMDRYGVT